MPEMLPMVITACLAKGSLAMGKKQTIIKDLNACRALEAWMCFVWIKQEH